MRSYDHVESSLYLSEWLQASGGWTKGPGWGHTAPATVRMHDDRTPRGPDGRGLVLAAPDGSGAPRLLDRAAAVAAAAAEAAGLGSAVGGGDDGGPPGPGALRGVLAAGRARRPGRDASIWGWWPTARRVGRRRCWPRSSPAWTWSPTAAPCSASTATPTGPTTPTGWPRRWRCAGPCSRTSTRGWTAGSTTWRTPSTGRPGPAGRRAPGGLPGRPGPGPAALARGVRPVGRRRRGGRRARRRGRHARPAGRRRRAPPPARSAPTRAGSRARSVLAVRRGGPCPRRRRRRLPGGGAGPVAGRRGRRSGVGVVTGSADPVGAGRLRPRPPTASRPCRHGPGR